MGFTTVTPFHFVNETFLDVSFEYPDNDKAQQTLTQVVNAFIRADQRLYPSTVPPTPFPGIVMEVLDKASLPVSPTKPNRSAIVMTGGILGLLAAAVVALIRRRWKPETDLSSAA